jgi:hypothetical protein
MVGSFLLLDGWNVDMNLSCHRDWYLHNLLNSTVHNALLLLYHWHMYKLLLLDWHMNIDNLLHVHMVGALLL